MYLHVEARNYIRPRFSVESYASALSHPGQNLVVAPSRAQYRLVVKTGRAKSSLFHPAAICHPPPQPLTSCAEIVGLAVQAQIVLLGAFILFHSSM